MLAIPTPTITAIQHVHFIAPFTPPLVLTLFFLLFSVLYLDFSPQALRQLILETPTLISGQKQ